VRRCFGIPRRKIGPLTVAAAVALAAVSVAAAETGPTVPNLIGKPRRQAEALLAQRNLLYKPRRPSSRYELPQGALGVGDALTVVPEEQSPDRLVTGQDLPPGTFARTGEQVDFSTSPRPPGSNRRPVPIEIARTSLGSDGRSLTVGLATGQLADSCRPLDHVDVAPRPEYVLVTPYVNVTDEAGACVRRARTTTMVLRRKTGGKPIVERAPVPSRDNLFHVASVPWNRVRLESAGRYAVAYFQSRDGCGVYSHATVTPRGQDAALTIYDGTSSENPSFCPIGSPRYLVLVPIPQTLVGRAIVDGSKRAT
jgi:hypothetical protein